MNEPFNFIENFFNYRDELRFKPPGGGLTLYERLVNYCKYRKLKKFMNNTLHDFRYEAYNIYLERCDIEEIIDIILSADFHYYINTGKNMYTKYKLGENITVSLADENHVRNRINNICSNGITCFHVTVKKERIKISHSGENDIFISPGYYYGCPCIHFEVFSDKYYKELHIVPSEEGKCYIDEFPCEDKIHAESYFTKINSLLNILKDIDNMPAKLSKCSDVYVETEHAEVNFEESHYSIFKYPVPVINLYSALAEIVDRYMEIHRNHINSDLMQNSCTIANYCLRDIYIKALADYINNYLEYIFKRYVSGGSIWVETFSSIISKTANRFHSFAEWSVNGDTTNSEEK